MKRYPTKEDAKNAVKLAIEAGGAAYAYQFDIDAIVNECYEYRVDRDQDGNELLDTAGFKFTCESDDAFWAIVQKHEKTS